jgi:hypothetical protein
MSRSALAVAGPLALGGAALILAWAVFLPRPAALYDGLGFPDEPYRFVHPPAGYRHTLPPSTARGQVADSGRSLSLMTAEQGPQVSLRLAAGSLGVANATAVVSIDPVGAPIAAVPAGYIVSNVYRISASAPLVGRTDSTIQMRAPTAGQPGPGFEVLTSTGWQTRSTDRVGNDIYQARFDRLGDWALIQTRTIVRNGQYDFGTPDSFGVFEAVLAVGGPVAILGILVYGIRSSRTRRRRREAARP